MKKFFKNFWWIFLAIIMIIIVIGCIVVGAYDFIQDVWYFIINIGGGSWVKGLIFFPFCIMGIIQVVRGFFAIIQKDLPEDIPYIKLPWKQKALSYLYWISTILGYAILFISIQNIAH